MRYKKSKQTACFVIAAVQAGYRREINVNCGAFRKCSALWIMKKKKEAFWMSKVTWKANQMSASVLDLAGWETNRGRQRGARFIHLNRSTNSAQLSGLFLSRSDIWLLITINADVALGPRRPMQQRVNMYIHYILKWKRELRPFPFPQSAISCILWFNNNKISSWRNESTCRRLTEN